MKILYIYMSVCLLFSCKDKKGYEYKDENGGDEVYSFRNDDEEMNAAVSIAKKSFDEFLTAFKDPDSLMEDFAVKMKFSYGENSGEHMWLNSIYFKDEKLFGVLDSDPIEITSLKSGDTLEIIRDSVSDWMYLRDNKLVGGYTIKVLFKKMSAKEKAEFIKEVDFEIE